MSDSASTTPPSPDPVPPEEGRVLGMPYDWRKPTAERMRARYWNPADRRLFPPKSFGMGWGLNAYWLAHPVRYVCGR